MNTHTPTHTHWSVCVYIQCINLHMYACMLCLKVGGLCPWASSLAGGLPLSDKTEVSFTSTLGLFLLLYYGWTWACWVGCFNTARH